MALFLQYFGKENNWNSSFKKDDGFLFIGLPCNDWKQEKGTDKDIMKAMKNQGIEFPITSKTMCNGKTQHPLFAYLKSNVTPKVGYIKWMFAHFLLDVEKNKITYSSVIKCFYKKDL